MSGDRIVVVGGSPVGSLGEVSNLNSLNAEQKQWVRLQHARNRELEQQLLENTTIIDEVYGYEWSHLRCGTIGARLYILLLVLHIIQSKTRELQAVAAVRSLQRTLQQHGTLSYTT